MMELQELELGLHDYSSDNIAFLQSDTDYHAGQGNTSYNTSSFRQHIDDNENSNEVPFDIETNKKTKTPKHSGPSDLTNPKNTEDSSATAKTFSGSETIVENPSDYTQNALIAPSIKAIITNDKCQDIYNRLTTAMDAFSHIESVQKKWIQENNVHVTLATITRHYKVTQIIAVMEELISIITKLGNYDDKYFSNNPILDQMQQESRVAHDIAENAYFCDHVTEKFKLEGYIATLSSSLTDLLDSIASLCSEYDGTIKPQGLLQILEQIRNVRKKLPTGYQKNY